MRPNWDSLLDNAALASVLPAGYAHFARPIAEGLSVFLNGLPEADQAGIVRAQALLGPTASISQRLGHLARSCPVLQKLGQLLARDQRLVPDLRRQLRQLESLAPTVPLETIKQSLMQELGPIDARQIRLVPPAIAEASVAVVIPFQTTTPRGGVAVSDGERSHQGAQGVFKILKPGIEDRLERELTLLERVGEVLDQRCDELRIPHLDYQESFQQVRDKLRDEVRLENEQRHLVQARAFFAEEPRVHIPRLYDHCTSRVTSMERITGGKVTGHGLGSGRKKRRLAGLVARALIARPVFSKADRALFHGDPHAGNLFWTDEGRLAILDWSLVGRLSKLERATIVQVMLGAVTLDGRHIVSALARLADRERLDEDALLAVVQAWLARIRRGQVPGLSWLVGMLDEATQSARLRVAADLMLFRKSLHTLEGVVAEVGESSGQIDNVLLSDFLRHLALEWPLRWLRPPNSRDFATRLSNLDLARTMMSGPTTCVRFWTGHAVDMLEAGTPRVLLESPCPSNH